MAQLSKPAIPPKMYRNFAVVTCALTALLALFANGAPGETTGGPTPHTSRAATRSPTSSPTGRPTPAYGEAQLDTGSTIQGGNGYELYEEFGGQDIREASGRVAVSAIGATETPRSGSENAGFTRDYLDSLTDEELEELLRQLRSGGADDPARRQQIMAVLETGSRRRSGGN